MRYKIYHVQSLIKAGLYEEASQACTGVESPEYTERVLMLQAGSGAQRGSFAGMLFWCKQSSYQNLSQRGWVHESNQTLLQVSPLCFRHCFVNSFWNP